MTTPAALPSSPDNFVDHLRELALHRPHDVALVVVGECDGEATDTPITYAALDVRVRALAVQLGQRVVRGDRALILLENGDHYVVAFFACLAAGVVAVPVFPPESNRPQHLARLIGIAEDSGARVVLTTHTIASTAAPLLAGLPKVEVVAVDDVDPALAPQWDAASPSPDDLAFLQYTSGSTSSPKGVMVTHASLMANERAIEEGLAVGRDDVFVTWLPLFHDMGLIGGVLQPLHRGIRLVLMPTRFILERPIRWLQAMARHRGTISGGPDFAYRLCVERVKEAQLESLDLSSWRVAFSGAEPVRHDTLEAFIDHFAPAGFLPSAVYPCYGLAEATLFVTGGHRGAGLVRASFSEAGLAQGVAERADDGIVLVGCGHPPSGHEVAIVEAVHAEAARAGDIGEIWAAGPSIASGYWGKPAETALTFVEHQGRRWLRTGDLGFVHDGQLYVSGRLKDMITVRGHNLYPQDIERVVEAEVDAVRKGRVAAFSVVRDGVEGIGLAAEVSRGMQKLVAPQALADALGAAVSDTFGEPLSVVVLLNPGGLPKTTSGKLQRNACRDAWRERTADAYALFEGGHRVGSSEELPERPGESLTFEEARLADAWRQTLRLPNDVLLDRQSHFFGLGGNSLALVQLAVRLGDTVGRAVDVQTLFEHPRLGAMAEAIGRLPLRPASAPPAGVPVLPATRGGDARQLSHAQERQWFLWRMDPGSTSYHVAGVLRLEGTLDAVALRLACGDLVARHESLRTLFQVGADGVARQVVHDELPVAWHHAFVPESDDGTQEGVADALLQRIHDEPFDLATGPLVRVVLIELAPAVHWLAVVMHHIVSDGASMQVFVDELATCWRARTWSEVPALPPLEWQYIDHALWQRAWLRDGEGDRQLAWWRAQLGDTHPVLVLPSDRPRGAGMSHRAARCAFDLPPTIVRRVSDLAVSENVTPFMVFLAAFQVLLHRLGGVDDVRVGVPVANRQRPETQGVIGFFVNTLVLRSVFEGRPTLAQALCQARGAALGAQAHQDLPFDQLVEALQPRRSLSHTPLFQVMFNYLKEDRRSLANALGLQVSGRPSTLPSAPFELTLDVCEQADGGWVPSLRYAAELFDASTMARLACQYLGVLEALVQRPDTRVDAVPLMSPEDVRLRLEAGAARVETSPGAVADNIHAMIERRAAAAPEAIALIAGAETLTYGALNERANRLAHHLVHLGVRPESRVGLALGRSVALIVATLAVLKAGAGYVPLDPHSPEDRLRFIAEDSGVRWVLTDTPAPAWVTSLDLTALAIDTLDLSGEPATDPCVPVVGNHLAYVIYTSGSTGRPKGAEICHHQVVRLLHNTQAWFTFDEHDVWTMFHSHAFDFSVWEMFGALCHGGRLVVVPHAESRDPLAFADLLRTHRVTVLNQTPSAFSQLMPVLTASPLSLRVVVFGGEALEPAALRPWLERFGDSRPHLVNMYGITETTVHVTYRRITMADLADGQRSPIGVQIPDLSLRVLDANLDPVPVGVAGELHVSGAGLARGYLNRAALTADRFIADPFQANGGRLYRTGDLVRWRADGEIDYLGRADQQVKVRGFRIEPGEVQARLLSLPDVRDALVLARPGPGGLRLVAYVLLRDGVNAVASDLRESLARELPDYMVPSAIVVLPDWPLTVNGKVDRQALPEPVAQANRPQTPPQAGSEATIAAIWSELLGGVAVGRGDNFFEIGGHSLLLMKVHHQIEERLKVQVAVVDLFRHPTVQALASFLDRSAAPDRSLQHVADRARRQRAAFPARKASIESTTP